MKTGPLTRSSKFDNMREELWSYSVENSEMTEMISLLKIPTAFTVVTGSRTCISQRTTKRCCPWIFGFRRSRTEWSLVIPLTNTCKLRLGILFSEFYQPNPPGTPRSEKFRSFTCGEPRFSPDFHPNMLQSDMYSLANSSYAGIVTVMWGKDL